MPLGQYEPETAAWMLPHVQPGSIVFDVGANAGYFTLACARAVGPPGQVHAFEPVPRNVEVLELQLRANPQLASRVTIVEAVADRNSARSMFTIEANNPTSHFADIEMAHAAERPRDVIEVPTVSVDDYVDESGRAPDLMKIDVEGGETRVLGGAMETLKRHHPALIVSTHSDHLMDECHDLLAEAGYNPGRLEGFEHEIVADHTDPSASRDSSPSGVNRASD